MQVLYITRKFPPNKGGMERTAYELYTHLLKYSDKLYIVKKSYSKRIFLILIFPFFFLRSSFVFLFKKIDVVYLQDGLLAPLGFMLKVFRKPIVATIHGLDVSYNNIFYQHIIPWCLKHFDRIICISENTKLECIKRGISEKKITVIPNGVSDIFYMNVNKKELKRIIQKKYNLNLDNKSIFLSVGRLVERKGFHWFIGNVMPKIIEKKNSVIYLIVGSGPFKNKIIKQINQNKLDNHVFLIGDIDDNILKILYNLSDILIVPNIPVEGDMEGFGVVTIEASSCGLPVISSKLEGLTDAVKDNVNGFLVDYKNTDGYLNKVFKILNKDVDKDFFSNIRKLTLHNYNWKKISEKYFIEFESLVS